MRIPRLFAEQRLNTDSALTLNETQSRYLIKVLRLKTGDQLVIFNGQGGEFTARLLEANAKRADVQLEHWREGLSPPRLHVTLAVGLSRGERMDWLVQKASELGVSEIRPLFSQRCEVRLSAQRAEKRCQHWRQVAISACEQCQRNEIPLIHTPLPLDDFLQSPSETEAPAFLLQPASPSSLNSALQGLQTPRLTLLSGPEGGFTEAESRAAKQTGIQPVSLGPRVLRTETAPLAALALAQAILGDLS